MSDRQETEDFLARWSRRKVEARRTDSGDEPVARPEAVAAPSTTVEPPRPTESDAPLPAIEDLHGLESEYRDFLRPGVDETQRRAALGKLFRDPHFNTMDGLDTYIDDYSKADPIPDAMLKSLNQAKGLIFDREDERGQGEATGAEAARGQDSLRESPAVSAVSSLEQDEAADDDAGLSRLTKPGAAV